MPCGTRTAILWCVPDSEDADIRDAHEVTTDSDRHPRETHATTGGAAAAGAVTGGVIGLTGGPIGAAIGAVGGAIVGAAAERMMHSDEGTTAGAEDAERADDAEREEDTEREAP